METPNNRQYQKHHKIPPTTKNTTKHIRRNRHQMARNSTHPIQIHPRPMPLPRPMESHTLCGPIKMNTIKTLLLAIILLLITTNANAHNWYYHHYHKPYTINRTPAHARYTTHPPYHYQNKPYGGYNYRPWFTNYPPADTSYGYRTHRPTARQLGITGQKLSNPNPRSLYR